MTNSSLTSVWPSFAMTDLSQTIVKVPSAFSVTLLYGALGLSPVGAHSESLPSLPVV
mgnify:CR=1 FL=1